MHHSLAQARGRPIIVEWERRAPGGPLCSKGDIALCGNYRRIKLTSDALKLFEEIIASRLISIVSENQYLLFINLKKAFGRIPRKLVGQAIKDQNFLDYNLERRNTETCVEISAGLRETFHLQLEVRYISNLQHQASEYTKGLQYV
ncbi:hypothetical protein EVAR_32899_1 [Eumeta japonica]|uniref:Reverse transcriptase domain-containing protein n=1 Tax=Eumeta variegata TaxID=151549 RepID=A0A4C1VRS8_EUMVA|nr:hypothetical protein EVAR_32899_1 [Eumeta japonica]